MLTKRGNDQLELKQGKTACYADAQAFLDLNPGCRVCVVHARYMLVAHNDLLHHRLFSFPIINMKEIITTR